MPEFVLPSSNKTMVSVCPRSYAVTLLSLVIAINAATAFSPSISFGLHRLPRPALRQRPTVLWTASSGSESATTEEPVATSLASQFQSLAEKSLEKKKAHAPNSTAPASQPASSLPVARLPLPGFELESIGLRGRWEEELGSYYLPVRPGVEARGVLHFLGGAFIGAAPHLGYKYFLEALSDEGYAVICTPYNLSFSYVDVCAGLVARSEGALRRAQGHSCGALLHTLLPCFFPSYSPAASVLISYNNKPAAESIPSFEELVVPVSKALLDSSETATMLRQNLERAVSEAREAKELLPISRQGLKVVEQLPDLLLEIKDGKREYSPDTQQVAELLNAAFNVPSSLIIQFEEDTLDESDKLASILDSGAEAEEGDARKARKVRAEKLDGSHLTPLTQDVFISTPFDSFDPLLPIRRFARQESLRQVEGLLSKVLPFLEEQASKR